MQIAADVNDLTGYTGRLSVRLKGPPPQGIRKGGTIRSSGGNDLGQKPGKVRSRPHIVPTLLLGAAGILPGGCRRQAPLPFDEALREKVFFGYQVLIQVSRTRGTPRLFFAVPRSTKVSYRSTIVLMPRSFLMVWGLSTSFKQFGKREKKIPSSKGRRNATFELNIGSPSRAAAGVRTASSAVPSSRRRP